MHRVKHNQLKNRQQALSQLHFLPVVIHGLWNAKMVVVSVVCVVSNAHGGGEGRVSRRDCTEATGHWLAGRSVPLSLVY